MGKKPEFVPTLEEIEKGKKELKRKREEEHKQSRGWNKEKGGRWYRQEWNNRDGKFEYLSF